MRPKFLVIARLYFVHFFICLLEYSSGGARGINQGHERLSDESRARQEIFKCLAPLLTSTNFWWFANESAKEIDAWITGIIRIDETFVGSIHRIHKWRTSGKKLVPSHESEALEDKQKLQMKTFSELAECLARIPPKITLYGRLFKYNYVGCPAFNV